MSCLSDYAGREVLAGTLVLDENGQYWRVQEVSCDLARGGVASCKAAYSVYGAPRLVRVNCCLLAEEVLPSRAARMEYARRAALEVLPRLRVEARERRGQVARVREEAPGLAGVIGQPHYRSTFGERARLC